MQDPHEQLNARLDELERRLANHSNFLLNDIQPLLQTLRAGIDDLTITQDRFNQLEEAVADIAIIVFNQKAKWPVDRRGRTRRIH